MVAAIVVALMVAMLLMVVLAIRGPSVYDRLLAGNSFGTKTVLLIGVAGFAFGRPDFLDISIAYSLINFLATLAMMKFFRYRSLQASLTLLARQEEKSDAA